MHCHALPCIATHAKFRRVKRAYDVLSDPKKRKVYDKSVAYVILLMKGLGAKAFVCTRKCMVSARVPRAAFKSIQWPK